MPEQQQRSSVVVFSLLVVLLVLAIIAATAAAIFVFSDRFTSVASPWVSPLSAIKAGAINPALSLRSLAGADDQTIVEQAVANRSTETALAILLYSTSLHDQTRTTSLLTVATALAREGKKDKSAVAAQVAVAVAILSPIMPDYSRAGALSQAGEVLASMGRKNEAIHAYTVAATLAVHSGRIDASYRQLLLEGLADDLNRIGRKEQARELSAAVNADLPTLDTSPHVLASLLVPLERDESSAWAELDAATADRVSVAGALVTALEGNSPQPPETVRQALEKALVREDMLREQVYSAGVSQGDNLLQRVAFARARLDWLALKWRVARQGFGMALVPAWESQERDIEDSLSQACQEYYLVMRDAAVSLPQQTEAVQGAMDAILDQIKMGRLGLPPSAQEGALFRSLDEVERERMSLGFGQLYVTLKSESGSSQLTVISSQ
jgi:hypothetical protein